MFNRFWLVLVVVGCSSESSQRTLVQGGDGGVDSDARHDPLGQPCSAGCAWPYVDSSYVACISDPYPDGATECMFQCTRTEGSPVDLEELCTELGGSCDFFPLTEDPGRGFCRK